MAEHNDFGKQAEDAACKFLESYHYEILERNFRFLKAEIDIIAKHKNTLIIVEVKARADNHFINPEDAVNKKKMKLLIMAADEYSQSIKQDLEVRFDIISVLKTKENKLQIQHIPDAFQSHEV
ncbi:YraN family protein [Chryseobacterium sp. POL2]|uniref:YraN family protein n=1 Tax=Chryseobacterium sp. POL2 TaxID=2713414 RepID=UPI0013E1DBD5|nr:YraN family protein [Chryseobacterium sp. POL2]QIG90021.1 YraN family protein [Chryseobacterium sp. POL2]